MSHKFIQDAQDMGLDVLSISKGLFKYSDRYSEVIYRQLAPIVTTEDVHQTDGFVVPVIAIFTKAPNWTDYRYAGCVSDLYKFIGNDTLNQKIREYILSTGVPIITENTMFNWDYTRMRNEMIISNGQEVLNVGDVLPVMIVSNSYNGTRAASVSFGISIVHRQDRLNFAFNLGEMRQIHISNSNTSMTSAITSYMSVFSESITDMINRSFSTVLTEQEMLGVLDIIEGFGKKRREDVSKILSDIQKESQNILPTAWQMFLSITRYSSFEKNLNVKKLMENAAESVLVIPAKMLEVLEKLQSL